MGRVAAGWRLSQFSDTEVDALVIPGGFFQFELCRIRSIFRVFCWVFCLVWELPLCAHWLPSFCVHWEPLRSQLRYCLLRRRSSRRWGFTLLPFSAKRRCLRRRCYCFDSVWGGGFPTLPVSVSDAVVHFPMISPSRPGFLLTCPLLSVAHITNCSFCLE